MIEQHGKAVVKVREVFPIGSSYSDKLYVKELLQKALAKFK